MSDYEVHTVIDPLLLMFAVILITILSYSIPVFSSQYLVHSCKTNIRLFVMQSIFWCTVAEVEKERQFSQKVHPILIKLFRMCVSFENVRQKKYRSSAYWRFHEQARNCVCKKDHHFFHFVLLRTCNICSHLCCLIFRSMVFLFKELSMIRAIC